MPDESEGFKSEQELDLGLPPKQDAAEPERNTAIRIAREFHEAYERLAPQVGYKTREASAVPWDDVPIINRVLMANVVAELLTRGVIASVSPGSPERARPQLPDGEFARVEILGHDQHTGWVTDGTRAGAPVMVVRDWDGRVVAEVPGHSLYRYVPLPTPLKRPEPQRAITSRGWAVMDDDGDPF